MQGVDSKGSAVLGPYKFVSRDQRRMMALFSFSRHRSPLISHHLAARLWSRFSASACRHWHDSMG